MTTAESLLSLCRQPTASTDRARAALQLRDWLGCIAAARAHDAAEAFAAMAGTSPGRLVATALARAPQHPEAAAFLTGALGNALEMDDLHRASILHAGDVVCPAALAAALHAGESGPRLLDALVKGYEAAIRIGMAAAAGGYAVWYNSGTCGVFGAAMAAATALGLDDAQTLDALAHAGMQAAGLWQCRLEDGVAKQTATAHAARAGVTAALLARAGARGPRGIIDGPLGFFAGFYPQADPDAVTAGADRPWLIHAVSFKPWPACRHTHPVIAACLALRDRVDPAAITAVKIASYAAGLAFCDDPNPQSDHAARFSFQHCAAIALRHGAPSLAHFGPEARASLAPLRARLPPLSETAHDRAEPEARRALPRSRSRYRLGTSARRGFGRGAENAVRRAG